jgi:Beta-galactosidase
MSQTAQLTDDLRPPAPDRSGEPALTVADGTLQRAGAPHRLIAGSMHYFRVHPGHWDDRLARLADLGVNTLDTYIAWNFHERVEGERRFDGWRDVERYLELAADIGLDVVVRPGPYVCAEWDNGGLPAWLTGRDGIRLRTTDPLYLGAVERWFDELIPRLTALQASRGGPIVAVQVENEFGSYGDDQAYLRRVRDALVDRGVTELLYTADGPTEWMQAAGSIPGVLATATFGSRPMDAARLLRGRRTGEPFMCAEFWNGWFDHWGEHHNVRSAGDASRVVSDILDDGGSVSIYMAHGGTNFGLWSGANHDGAGFQPTVTSYDSDAPIAENGALTEKYFAIRRRIWPGACGGVPFDEMPATLTPRTLAVTRRAGLLDALRGAGAPVRAEFPPSFDQLSQASGLVLYRVSAAVAPSGARLRFADLHDRAIVYVDGRRIGVVDTPDGVTTIPGPAVPGEVLIEVLVENQGRINYGPLLGQGKGILGPVTLEEIPLGGTAKVAATLRGWQAVPLPIDTWSADELSAVAASAPAGGDAGFATATLTVEEPADAFLALPGFGKGFVWIGDELLGRYWEVGPQRTLYVPAPMLTHGPNTITVLELDRLGDRIELRSTPDLGPEREYIETF